MFYRGRLILVLMALVVAVSTGNQAVQQSYNGPGALTQTRTVVIPPGGIATVAVTLQQAGVIKYTLVFEAAAWLTRGQGQLRRGEFAFVAHGSLRRILHTLRFGQMVQHKATIPEGLTAVQIAALINALPDATGQIAPPPEGSVLPQTYDYTYGTSRAAILSRMQHAMTHALATAWSSRAPNLPLATPAAAVTLASIVQLETPISAELPLIAGVYENRLNQKMKLQADPTVIFAVTKGHATALAHRVDRHDLAIDSPYNTYLNFGLPPGPIASPGIAAINAVLHPAATSDLFFVATGTGGHVFAQNFGDQLANIARYHERTKRN
jgi:UPF0755 protein